MANQNTQIAKADAKRDIRTFIQSDSVKKQMEMVLPKHLSADRMARVACTAILKTPKLLECSPESLLQALMLCSQAGLEPDGRNAHLIPFGNQVQVIFDWKGLVKLARDNGIQNIAAEIVCENDVFEWSRDAEGLHFKHLVNYRKSRGEMFAAYCIWKDKDQFDGEVMTKDEIDGIRKRSRASNAGPWVTDYTEMCRKTVIRRATKKWPLDSERADALNDADSNPEPATVTSRPIFDTPAALPDPEPSKALPEPAAPTAPEQDEVPMEFPKDIVQDVRNLMKLGGVTDGEIMDYLHATGSEETLGSLEDVHKIEVEKLSALKAEWPKHLKEINKLKKGGRK